MSQPLNELLPSRSVLLIIEYIFIKGQILLRFNLFKNGVIARSNILFIVLPCELLGLLFSIEDKQKNKDWRDNLDIYAYRGIALFLSYLVLRLLAHVLNVQSWLRLTALLKQTWVINFQKWVQVIQRTALLIFAFAIVLIEKCFIVESVFTEIALLPGALELILKMI